MRTGYDADLLVHPGETVQDVLQDRNMTLKELSRMSKIPESRLNDVIAGKADITADLGAGLALALDVPDTFWTNLQKNYDMEKMLYI